MAKYTIFYLLILCALQGVQALLSALGDKTDQDTHWFLVALVTYRLAILPSLAVLITGIPLLGQYVLVPRQVKHKFRKDMLATMRSKIFGNDRNVRISIFKDAWWIRVLGIYVWENLWHPIVWYQAKSRFTYPRRGKYIRVSERAGTEHSKSKTYFWVSGGSWRDCEGIAAVARHINGEQEVYDLPDINHIDLSREGLLSVEEARLVDEYMTNSLIKNFDALKRIFIKARHLYANVLLDKNAKTVAVLVIDSNADDSPITPEVKATIGGYVELFTSTFV